MARPVIAIATILAFNFSWNNFIFGSSRQADAPARCRLPHADVRAR
jgi:ABC-type glycerol-3-phosphate transport system permease component